jgi:hypothetical protein
MQLRQYTEFFLSVGHPTVKYQLVFHSRDGKPITRVPCPQSFREEISGLRAGGIDQW